MVVQHNLPALNALRQKTTNNINTAKNLEKLSSGYRVSSAGDDAAGLGISEKMRGQISGLSMAAQNAQNGISLIKTAEGGLNEIHAILHRMRELGVQASNGTYQQDDREQISKEVEALKSEIDRIAGSTHYNGIKLLDGTLGGYSSTSFPGGPGYSAGSYAALAARFQKMGFAVDVSGNPANVKGTVSVEIFSGAIQNEKANLIVTSATDSMRSEGGGSARVIMQIGDNTYKGNYLKANDTILDADGVAQTVFANTYVFLNHDGRLVASMENITSADARVGVGDKQAFPNDILSESGVITGIPLAPKGSVSKIMENISPAGDVMLAFPHPLSEIMLGDYSSSLEFQIGANGHADQRVGLHVPNMSSASLGTGIRSEYNTSGMITGIDIFSVEQANDALIVIDAAVMQVSGTRAQLGSLQNRLEHTFNNLGVTVENLTAAESSIRDVDMAKEMMEFAKNNILSEASQAMLAQANQLPQGLLSLLR